MNKKPKRKYDVIGCIGLSFYVVIGTAIGAIPLVLNAKHCKIYAKAMQLTCSQHLKHESNVRLLMTDNLQRRRRRANQLCRRGAYGHAGSAGSAAGRIPPGASVRRRQRHDDGHLRPDVVVDVVVVVVGRVVPSATAAAAAGWRRRDAHQPHRELLATDHVAGRHSCSLLEPRRHRVV